MWGNIAGVCAGISAILSLVIMYRMLKVRDGRARDALVIVFLSLAVYGLVMCGNMLVRVYWGDCIEIYRVIVAAPSVFVTLALGWLAVTITTKRKEIGRASCRERV